MTKTITQLLADTTSSQNTGVQAKQWLKIIVDTAQKEMHFLQLVQQYTLQPGWKDLAVPIRSDFISSWQSSASEGSAVNYTQMDTLSTVTFTPSDSNYGIAISNRALRISNINLITAARDELTYKYKDLVDQAIRTAILGATDADSDTKGAQSLAGGDASGYGDTTTDVTDGDIITTDMVARARRLLMSTNCYYWSGGSMSKSSATKAPWVPTPAEPFVLVIAPEQQEAFLKDPQFINAAEYGAREPILNGEIGNYLGVKIVVSNNLPAKTSSDDGWNTNGHVCFLLKAKRCAGLTWGQRPRLKIIDYPSELEKRIILEMAYQAKVLHADAVVKLKVADA